MAENVGRYHLNMLQDKTFQRSFPDIVPAAPLQLTAFAMAAAVEESVFNLVVIVRIEHHSCSAVRTIDQPGKHAASPGSGLPVTMTPDLLNSLKNCIGDNGFVMAWKDSELFFRISPPFLIPDGIGIGFEIYQAAGILTPFEHGSHGGT